MNAVQIIERDHKKMRSMFERFKKAKSPDKKKSIMDEILTDLKGHSDFEEELVYPPARIIVGEEMIDESEEEHHLADTLMAELLEMDGADEKFEAKATVLEEMLLHHMEEEEKEMLPKLAKVQKDTFGGADLESERKAYHAKAQEMIQGRMPARGNRR